MLQNSEKDLQDFKGELFKLEIKILIYWRADMAVIYFNNFRGFSNTFLQLKDVNFFVGENSTGKTSVLKLINSISDRQTWLTNVFSSDLGYFSEIISSNCNQNFYEVGFLNEVKGNSDEIRAMKLKFVEIGGLPALQEIRMIADDLDIQAKVNKETITYRFGNIPENRIKEDKLFQYFKFWICNDTLHKKRYTKEEKIGIPLLFQIQFLMSSAQKNKSKKSRGFSPFPSFLESLTWLAPIRSEPKSTYDRFQSSFNPNGEHAPYILKQILNSPKKTQKENVEKLINQFGEESSLFDNIEIRNLGKTETSAFEIHVSINKALRKITNVGYGISQVLPLIVEILASSNNTWFAIQQPEVHLHPKAQAAFGDFTFHAFNDNQKKFIIETHSDYTIDRFRLNLNKENKENKEKKLQESKSQVVFFTKNEKGNQLTCIPILNDGSYHEEQPEEFRDFFIKEQLDLLKI